MSQNHTDLSGLCCLYFMIHFLSLTFGYCQCFATINDTEC